MWSIRSQLLNSKSEQIMKLIQCCTQGNSQKLMTMDNTVVHSRGKRPQPLLTPLFHLITKLMKVFSMVITAATLKSIANKRR